MEGNWQKSPISKPSMDDVLGALRYAGANGKNSILGRKAVEIYEASEGLRVPQEISSQSGALDHVENLLNRVLRAVRTIQGSSSTSMVYRSLLRRKDHSMSEAQLQNYTDQLYHMLFHFQAWLSLSQRVNNLEDRTRLEGKTHSIFPANADSLPSLSLSFSPPESNPFISSVSGASSMAIQHGYPERVRSDPLVSTPSNPVCLNSKNPFLPLIESGGFPRDATRHVAPLVPPVATDISLRTSHVGGSSSTVSKVDSSTKENYNNVINNVTHNVTANFNGNIFMPAFLAPGYPPSPGHGGGYNSGSLGYNVHRGNALKAEHALVVIVLITGMAVGLPYQTMEMVTPVQLETMGSATVGASTIRASSFVVAASAFYRGCN
ncbi:hypothetical protein BDP27DRAFT_1360436 [Rhodocollybia butyracea]|uniref:Uncharacterized protein n=1 Tax=Rhodocollybia butyracea TaxID=206335 RepID=A0A9P5UBM5_9AGAR|nr:hypothetical protein BDP27DRAFT_1360436 [Rhodocollybia butyracea]